MVLTLCAVLASAGQTPPRKPAQVTLTLTGLSTFNGPLKGTREIDPVGHRITVEGRGPDDLFIRLNVGYPSKAPFKVMLEGLGGARDRSWGV